MDYANVTDKNEEEVFQQLTEQIKRLLNYTCTLETIEKDGSFIEFNIVGEVMYLNSKFAIKITDETTIIRAFNKNWLVDYVTKGDE